MAHTSDTSEAQLADESTVGHTFDVIDIESLVTDDQGRPDENTSVKGQGPEQSDDSVAETPLKRANAELSTAPEPGSSGADPTDVVATGAELRVGHRQPERLRRRSTGIVVRDGGASNYEAMARCSSVCRG